LQTSEKKSNNPRIGGSALNEIPWDHETRNTEGKKTKSLGQEGPETRHRKQKFCPTRKTKGQVN